MVVGRTGSIGSGRFVIVVADDFGIGDATSAGILDLAREGLVTATVLLVNSPFAERAVREWRQSGVSLEVGWHPCLNLDRPILPVERVPSLVGRDGNFLPLSQFIPRLLLGRLNVSEIRAELVAQYQRFHELVGHPPTLMNAHKHLHVFEPIGGVLREILGQQQPPPYIRRIREPWISLARVPGGRVKRVILSTLGRRAAHRQVCCGFPGNDWLVGITNASCVNDPEFFLRWLRGVPGQVVELTCHPGHWDPSLFPRDCPADELERRPRERDLLRDPSFRAACRAEGFTVVSPSPLAGLQSGEASPAA